jgi:serine/threonine-protein kinase
MAEVSDPKKPVSKELTGRIGKYELKRLLGKGAMGQVYLAHDTVLDRDVALKVMASQIADDPELKQRFEREARAVARMPLHPNVAAVFDMGTSDGSPYFAMEFLDGQDLQKAMRQPPPMSLERKVAIIVQVLAGLAHAHKAGLVHRDIKPANIFIKADGSAKITDFGVVRETGHSMTGTGNVMGTADYMSPEQVKGERVDGRSDLFAVGCMLFELAAGRRPFHADNLMAIFYKITHEEANFDLIPQGADHDALMPILKKALAKNLDDRYQTAYEFAVDLREWLKAHATTASTQNVLESLVDLEAPTHPPAPLTDAPGVRSPGGELGATVELGKRGPRKGTLAPTRVGGKTLVDSDAGATVRPGPSRPVPTSPVSRVPARPQPEPKTSVLPWLAMGLALVAVGVAGFLWWKSQQAPTAPPAALATAPPVTQTPPTTVATPAPPPVTVATPPPPVEAAGKAAASIRAAQSALDRGDFDRALAAAGSALGEDPGNQNAQQLQDRARAGQRALSSARAGEAALARGDVPAAEQAAAEAMVAAPWAEAAVSLRNRIDAAKREAEARVQSARAAEITGLLTQATDAIEKKQFEAAIAAYNRVLELDPANRDAIGGKTNALTLKGLAEAPTSGGRATAAVRSFVPGKTEAKGSEQGGAGPVGFEDSAGVVVKKGTAAAELPGRIVFEASPLAPKAGDRFRVTVLLSNEGSQPIQLATAMTVVTIVDGKRMSGPPLTPSTTTVAPGQRAPVYQMPEQVWKEGTSSWTMEVALRTAKGETYKNALSWK